MARPADHEQRRRQIAEAVWRLAARHGLESVTLRQVATEAGVSMRLVQYYFGTRSGLLLSALELLNADAERTGQERIAALGTDPGPRALLRGLLLELLPLDEQRRLRHVVYAAYFVRFLTDPDLTGVAAAAPPALEELAAMLIDEGKRRGDVDPAIDNRAEAELLLAAASGLQGGVLLNQISPERAVTLIDHQLDRVFTDEDPPQRTPQAAPPSGRDS
ncbi:TetR family transcriptional regulator C-terminal domain-containing protein [Amycolatopsis sp. NPDC051128]|uniref:TetR/AcrR family transcriptional regulator n=1 Tax=Amycolatopsis sp. NPDC051128 TaxID=3155412 RepID=UPI0034332845